MSIGHRTNRLKIKGSPSVEKLQNNRYKLIITCSAMNSREDWYSVNKDRIFPDFGSLQSAEMSIDGLAPRAGEAYTDMRLTEVESGNRSPRDGSDYIIVLTYETLGSSFVQIKDDTIDLELNGLRRVTRTSIAQAGTDIPVDDKDIGVDYINHQIDSEAAVRCFLSSYEINDTDSYREFERTYIQAGELSRDVRSVGRGVQQTTHQFLVTEGTTTGDVISRDTDNFLGLKRITVSVIARPDGTTLTNPDGSAKLSYQQQQLVPFTFPGVVDLQDDRGHIFPAVRSPVQAKIEADVYTYYQSDTSDIVSGDFTTQSALGLWNPSEWCQKISTISASRDKPAYFNAQGLRGCRTRESFTLSGNLQESLSTNLQYTALGKNLQLSELMLEETTDVENGKSVFRQVINYFFDVTERFDFQNIGGVGTFRPGDPLVASGTFTLEVKWTGSQWQLTGTNVVVDVQATASAGSPAVTYVFSRAANSGAGGFLEGYTNQSGDQGSVSVTATGGGTNPWNATWPTGATASESSNTEEYVRIATPIATLTAGSVAATFSYIEGRAIEGNGVGKIKISGGPPNPLGKVYTLDVNLEKVFTKIDGTAVYRKTITTATCTPA
jgi:hypothetical protein